MVPTVAMSSAAPDPTNTSPIPVTAQFSENVTGFTAADIVAGNATVTSFVAVDGDTYTFNLLPSGQGLVTADVPAGVAQDSDGNPNNAAVQFSRTFDSVGPAVTVNQAAGQADLATSSPVNFTVAFAEAVTGFSSADVAVSGTAGATTALVSGSGATYNVAVSGMSSNGTVIATVGGGVATDAAGNTNSASSSTDNSVRFNTPGVRVTPAIVSTAEGGATATYQVVLASQPTNDVTISITTDGQTTVSPAFVTFTPSNWSALQTVTTTAVDDAAVEGPHASTISHSAASLDDSYGGITIPNVTASISDNDRISGRPVYLPLLLVATPPPLPDLVVERVNVTHSSIQVVIRNQGPGQVTSGFWVDVYIEPRSIPTGANQIWPALASQGLV
jgi:hypothetical protein